MGWCWAEQHWELVLGALGCSAVGLKHLCSSLWEGNGESVGMGILLAAHSHRKEKQTCLQKNEKWVGMMASDNHGTVLLE